MTQEVSQTQTGEMFLASFDLIAGASESTRAKTAETFLELLGARVRNPNTRSAYRVAWRSFLAFCSARQLELESVKAYHVGAWLDQHPGSRSTQRQHLAAVRLLFDSRRCSARHIYPSVHRLFCQGKATGCHDRLYPDVALASSFLTLGANVRLKAERVLWLPCRCVLATAYGVGRCRWS